MAEKLIEFDKPEFSVEKYTKDLTNECVGGPELQQRKKELQAYYDHTSATLKKSVYANYKQFIDTAKEISHLESEMYQLSHILTQQRIILAAVADEKSGQNIESENNNGDSNEADHTLVDNNQATRAVQEMVQGFKGNLDGKTFLNEGALIELDPNDYRPIQRVFFFLFNDVLLVCKVKHDKRLEFMREYDPKKIAVINIKDLDGVRNAINIITPDGSKIYQCVISAGKVEWIEKFEMALRFDQQKQLKKLQNPAEQSSATNKTKLDTMAIKSISNYSQDSINNSELSPTAVSLNKKNEYYLPEWIQVASEEIQTLIALRYFEEAQTLISRSQEHLAKNKSFSSATDIAAKVKMQETSLANVLLHELSNCRCRNLQVALRASKRLIKILVDMGRARQACNTLLKVCTVALRTAQREARRNNDEISEIFFCDLAQVACEFLSVFEQQAACVSALVVWCNAELQYFATQLIKHYLTKGIQLDAIAKCMEGVRKPCAKLTEIGIDLSYHLEGLLRAPIRILIDQCKERLLETIGRTEESWQPYNLQTKSNLKRLLNELDILGIDIRSRTTGDTWINLTQSTVLFTRQFLQLTEHCAILSKNEVLAQSLEFLLREMLMAQNALKPATGMSIDPNFVMKNKRFLIDDLLGVAIKKFFKICGNKPDVLIDLQKKSSQQQPPIPKQRSVYQTDVI